jgi:hypothetical protein
MLLRRGRQFAVFGHDLWWDQPDDEQNAKRQED